jgi:hypothetical protein
VRSRLYIQIEQKGHESITGTVRKYVFFVVLHLQLEAVMEQKRESIFLRSVFQVITTNHKFG